MRSRLQHLAPRLFSLWVMVWGSLFAPMGIAQDSPYVLLKQMMVITSNNGGTGRGEELNALKQRIEALPKPARGNKKKARIANDKGLAAFKAGDYENAKNAFLAAYQADPADVEIAGNLGMVHLKLGQLTEALKPITVALTLSPGRASTWANLAEYYALQDRTLDAVACYALAFHFSQNQDKTRDYLGKLAGGDDSPKVRQAAQQALQLGLIQGNGGSADSLAAPLAAPTASAQPPMPPATVAAIPPPVPAMPTVAPPAPVPQAIPGPLPSAPATMAPQAAATTPPMTPPDPTPQVGQDPVSLPGSPQGSVDKPAIKTVISTGMGTDVPSAAQNAAQNALTNVVGSFMDASKLLEKRVEIQDGLRRETQRIDTNIKEYSQGSIQSFEVLRVENQSGLINVAAKMGVRVEDFKLYVKKLAEGEVNIAGESLFAQAATQTKQKENKLALLVENILDPIASGQVIEFIVGKPEPIASIVESGQYGESLKDLIEKFGSENIFILSLQCRLNPQYLANTTKLLDSIASKKNTIRGERESDGGPYMPPLISKKFNLDFSRQNVEDVVFYINDHDGANGFNRSEFKLEAYLISRVSKGLVSYKNKSFNLFKKPLEISLLDEENNVLQYFKFERRYIYHIETGYVVPDNVFTHDGIPEEVPWQLIRFHGSFFDLRSHHLFKMALAIDPAALSNTKKIRAKLVD